MKKYIIISGVLFAFAITQKSSLNAQAFETGNNIVSAGYGAPNLNKALFKIYEDENEYSLKGYGPIHLKYEHAVSDRIGLGLSINHVASSMSYRNLNSYIYELNYSSTKFNARVNVHFASSDVFDAYWGIGAGYGTSTTKWTTGDPNSSNESFSNPIPIGLEATLGARYFFSENIGLYAEVGLAKSIVQGGFSFKF